MELIDQWTAESPQVAATAHEADGVYILPTSFSQQRLWFLSRFQRESAAYNLSGAFSIRGALDRRALERSLDEIVQRHEALRTTFSLFDGEPVQVVAPRLEIGLPLIDLGGEGTEQPEEVLADLLRREARRPFDLVQGPLLRVLLVRLAESEHVLFYSMHHIVTDGWSEGVFIRELTVLYRAFAASRPSPLPELPIQYGDFAQWQREWLQGDVLEELLAYWRERLAGAPAVLELPADHRRPAVFTNHGAMCRFSVPEGVAAGLRALARAEGTTLFATLLAGFGVLLARHSGQDDLLVGSPVANRRSVELESLIGFFVNTLVLRLNLAGNPTFRELQARVREVTYGAQEHSELPFERIVTELKLERDLSRNPLVQVVFNMENTPAQEVRLADVSLSPLAFEEKTAKFDLTLGLFEAASGLAGALEYYSDLFDEATAKRLAQRLSVLLAAVAADPGRPILDLPLLSEGERAMLLGGWSGGRSFPAEACLQDLFATQVRRRPDEVAVVWEDRTLTYRELDQRSGQLARVLAGTLDGGQERVGICLERSLETVVAILATLKAGSAYVPLDPAYPPERLAYLVADSAVPVLVTSAPLATRFPGFAGRIVVVDRDGTAADPGWEAREPVRAPSPEAPAYVIYTSGSTGTPKGVVVSHANVVRLLAATQDWFQFGPEDVWTLFHSYAFDFSVWEIWGALAHGGRLVVVPYWVSRSPERFHRLLREEKVTVLNQTPSAFYPLIQADEASGEREDATPLALRWVVFGGEALDPQRLTPWFERHGDRQPRLVNMYGITETTVHVTYRPITRADAGQPASPIGVTLPDLRAHVLDSRGQLSPVGVPGELYVGGAGVASGYLGRPALTAERFLPDSLSGEPGARLYRSGDLARYRPDGQLEYLGRGDAQVKIHGFRIEPGEVEMALQQHPAISGALVLARASGGDQRLVAYVVAERGAEIHPDELRAFLLTKLPEHMVPSAFLELDAFPLTENGKIDRKALPEPEAVRPDLAVPYAPPTHPVEEALCAILATVLRVERVGIHDNFFSLGGDSIRTVETVALARDRGLDVSLQQLFQFPTVASLAREITLGAEEPERTFHTEPFSLLSDQDRARLPEGLEDAYPLTSLQAGMFYHREEIPDAPVFHNVNGWHLRMPFDADLFQQAVLHVARRHPILRTSFDMTSYSEPLQLVHREAVFPVGGEDLRHLSTGEQEKVLAERLESELQRPFDLSRPPQLRFHVYPRTDESVHLMVTENHAILDGWSLHVIFDDVLRTYFSLLEKGVPADLPPLRTRYCDFVAQERKALADPEMEAFWDRELADRSALRLPRLQGARRAPGRRVLRFDIPLPEDLDAGLKTLARSMALPLKSILLAAHFRVLSFLAGSRDTLTSLSFHGRPETTDAQRVCGLFLNIQPIRQKLEGGTWKELARATNAAELKILPYRRYPLAAIQKKWGREPLLETEFVYLNFHMLDHFQQTREVQIVGQTEFVEETNFPLVAGFTHNLGGGPLVFNLDCDRRVLSDPQILAIKDYYLATLRRLVDDPQGRYESFSPLSEAETHALFVEWNDTRRAHPPERPVHERIAEQALATPGHPAVTCGGETLSYRELDRRANQLAHLLRRSGAGPEAVVGLCFERSLDLVVGLLAVLKAGGAYLAIDPSTPRERATFMLRDAGAALVLTRNGWLDRVTTDGIPAFSLESLAEELAGQPVEPPAGGAVAGNLAYLIYTSGSTGTPKGVAVEHRQLANYLASLETYGFPPAATFAMVSTFAADLGHTMLFGALTSGGRLLLATEAASRDPEALVQAFSSDGCDVLKIVPSHLSALLEHPRAERLLPRSCLILGGEALDRELVERVRALAPGCRVYNEYGPTETTVAVTVQEVNREPGFMEATTVSIGRPMAGSRVFVRDSFGQPVAPGAPGELYIGGANVTRGYLGRPDLTAERFLPDPASPVPGARVYRTGDLVRHLPDGRLDFLGRGDEQVKVRGYRVEPSEIKVVLESHPSVREAAVVARKDAGELQLVAYAVPVSGKRIEPKALRSWLAERLPEHMLPAAVVGLPALPVTPNGKLDRNALPAPQTVSAGEGARRTSPSNPYELQLLQLWERLLGKRSFALDEDFFALGGDSLLALRLIAQIRKLFNQTLPLSALTEHNTVERLAAHLRDASPRTDHGLVLALQPQGTRPPFYCVAPGHGSVLSYLGLARHLGMERPFYGLQWPDLERTGDPFLTIEEMAARYIQALREKQPTGPYLLGGWSFGGLVAYEMARQLAAAEETVARLVLLDARTPAAESRLFELDGPLLSAFLLVEHAKGMVGPEGREVALSPHDLVGLELPEQLEQVVQAFGLQDRLPKDFQPEMVRRYLEVRLARMLAIKRYQPRDYPGRITLLRCREIYRDASLAEVREILERAAESPSYGWDLHAAEGVEIVEIPGDHEAIVFEPHVEPLAAALRKVLDGDAGAQTTITATRSSDR